MTLYPSVRAAQAFILRLSFAHPSLKVRRKLGGSSEKQVEAGGV